MELRGYRKIKNYLFIFLVIQLVFLLIQLLSSQTTLAQSGKCNVNDNGQTYEVSECKLLSTGSATYFCLPNFGEYIRIQDLNDFSTYALSSNGQIEDRLERLFSSEFCGTDYNSILPQNADYDESFAYLVNQNLLQFESVQPNPVVTNTPTPVSSNSQYTYVPQSGAQCMVNYADCQAEFGNNYSNLFEDINNGSIKLYNITKENFTRVFTGRATGLDKQKFCYDKTVYSGDIIAYTALDTFRGDGSVLSDLGYMQLVESFIATNGDTTLDLRGNTFVSACPIGTRATKSIFSFGINTFGLGFLGSQNQYNCCPQGYSFVNQANQSTVADSGVGVCCKGNPSEFSSGNANSCTKTDGTTISLDQHPKSNNLDTFIDDIRNGTALSPIYGGGIQGQILGFIGGTTSPSFITWGIPLIGQALNKVTFQSNTSAPSQICPDSFPANSCVRRTDANNVDTILSKENYDQQNAWQCTKCYLPGEAIRVDKDSQKLHVCDTTQPENYREENLINGNVNDTIAYLQADLENQPELKSCREQGGLYIAIGCVDPTPIGIITGAIRISFGVLGGVALLQIILAGIAYQSGEEARIQAARNRVFATLGGVSLLVFSVLVLRIIGVNVLDVVPSTFF